MIRLFFILDSLFCLPNRCGLYNGPESFLTLGRFFDPWSVFWLLVNLLSFGQFPDSWSIYYLLVNSLTLGQFIIFWSIPWLLVNYLTLVHFIKPWSVFRLLVNWPQFKPDSFNRFCYSIDQKSQALESIRPYRPRPVENMSHVDSSRFGIQNCPVNLSDRFFCSKPILQDIIFGLVY